MGGVRVLEDRKEGGRNTFVAVEPPRRPFADTSCVPIRRYLVLAQHYVLLLLGRLASGRRRYPCYGQPGWERATRGCGLTCQLRPTQEIPAIPPSRLTPVLLQTPPTKDTRGILAYDRELPNDLSYWLGVEEVQRAILTLTYAASGRAEADKGIPTRPLAKGTGT